MQMPQGYVLSLMLCCCHIKVLINFEKKALHLHFALGLTNDVANLIVGGQQWIKIGFMDILVVYKRNNCKTKVKVKGNYI